MKAEHQIRTIMAYRALGARFYGAGTDNKWVRFRGMRFYNSHYMMAERLEKQIRAFRRKKGIKVGAPLAYVRGMLEGVQPNIKRALVAMKKAIKR